MLNLVQAVKNGLEENEAEHEWDEQRIHISDLAIGLEGSNKKCPRQVWLRYNHYDKKDNSPGVKFMFEQGNNLHEFVAELISNGLPDQWEVIGIEEPVRLDFITGRYDFAIRNKVNDKKYIVDFKTVRGGAFSYLNEPKGSHTLQVQSYIKAKDYDGGFVLYIDREGQNFVKQFRVERDDKKVMECVEIARKLRGSEIPPAPMKPKIKVNNNKGDDSVVAKLPWQCKYCDFHGVSCDGAIPPEYEDKLGKVVGHIDDEGTFTEKVEGISEYIEGVI